MKQIIEKKALHLHDSMEVKQKTKTNQTFRVMQKNTFSFVAQVQLHGFTEIVFVFRHCLGESIIVTTNKAKRTNFLNE